MQGSLNQQKCSECRHIEDCEWDRQQRIKTALTTGKIAKGTRILLEDVKERLDQVREPRIKARLTAAIKQIEINEREEANMEWLTEEARTPATLISIGEGTLEEAHEFTNRGTYTGNIEAGQCPVCREPEARQEFISNDGRITACEECAKNWTEYTGTTTWWEIPKNE